MDLRDSMKMGRPLLAAALATAILAGACAPTAPVQQDPSNTPTPTGPTPTPVSSVSKGSNIVKEAFAGESQTLDGAGATFPAVLYTKWFNEYERVTKVKVNYQAIGSGGGIQQITNQTVDFGGTDGPMTEAQQKAAEDKGGPVLHIPMTLGAVVPTYNIPELGTKTVNFSVATLPAIYLGEIKKWNDPKLVADNPGTTLPDKDIIVVYRSDGSGTTNIFTQYLSAVNPKWKADVGVGNAVKWPTGVGGQGNQGVAGEVKNNPYSIGYVELIYAIQNKLGVGHMKNKAGKVVEPTLQSVTDAAAGMKNVPADLKVSIVDADGDGSYPIAGFTWLMVYQKQTNAAKASAITRLLWWATHDAQKFASELGYSPLPDPIVKLAEKQIASITIDGKAAFPHPIPQ